MTFLLFSLEAASVALMTAAAGELVLWRPSRSLTRFFESFAVGAGVASFLLFPLSLVLGSNALEGIFALLILSFSAVVALRFRGWKREPGETVEQPVNFGDPLSLLFLLAIGIATLLFALQNWRVAYVWDGFQIWASRAQMLFVEGMLAPERFPETLHVAAKIAYPPLVSLLQALMATLHGSFDFDGFKPLFLIFFIGMLVMTYQAARSVAGSRVALSATALIAFLPPLSTETAAGGYADMPLAFVVSAVVASALGGTPRRNHALPWLIGTLCFVKNEGMVYALITVAVVVIHWLTTRSSIMLRDRLRANLVPIAALSTMILGRIAYLEWIDYEDLSFHSLSGDSAGFAFGRMADVLRLSAIYLFDPRIWGLFWPAFFVALVIVLRRNRAEVRAIAISVLLSLAAFQGMFLLTRWDVALHVDQALVRLLSQVAPAAAVVIAGGYAILSAGQSHLSKKS